MKLTVQRHQEGKSYDESFDVASLKVTTLLAALYEIKAKLDETLTFDAGCRSGVCGACAVRVNGRETLACSYTPRDGDRIEPLNYHPVQRDLRVDKAKAQETLKKVLPRPIQNPKSKIQNPPLSPKEEALFRLQTDCILCDSCYSACPVLAVNPDFLGPFALTRAWRYATDPRYTTDEPQSDSKPKSSILNSPFSILDAVQTNGIWDCTLCGECTAVCPQHIDPKSDIMQLRGESLKAGYNDPNLATQSLGTPDFGGGFGFDPNAGF